MCLPVSDNVLLIASLQIAMKKVEMNQGMKERIIQLRKLFSVILSLSHVLMYIILQR